MTDNKDLSARWEWVLERAAKDLGISVGELKRRLVPPKLRTSEVERARACGAPTWVIDAIQNCPTDMMRDIAMRDNRAPTGPSSQGIIPTSQQLSNVRPGGGRAPINTTGWQTPTSIDRPQPGINYVDAQLDAQDRRDRADRERAEAMRRAALGRK